MSQSFERVAVIDIGKTNAKVVLVDATTGQEMAVHKTANSVLPGPPYPHFDTERLWAFILRSLSGFAREPGFDALSITTHGASAALLDATGALALPVLDYEHLYADEINSAYDALRPDFSETYSPRLTGGLNLGAQLHYQQRCFPEGFARVSTIVTYPQYWGLRLTGVAANEKTSLGCHTDLWLPFVGRFSPLVDRLGLTDKMAPIHSAFDVLGEIRTDIGREIGLSKPVPVYCGIHDSNASLLPHLVDRTEPCTVVSTGTWVICFAPGGQPFGLDPARDTLANVDAFGTPVPSARYMGGREWELTTAEVSSVDPEEEWGALDAVFGGKSMLLPGTVKGTGPFPLAQGKWTAESADAAERRAAASLYQALMTATCLEMIGSKGEIIVEGPFATNQIFLAGLRSLTNRTVLASVAQTGTALGAAILAGLRPRHSMHRVERTIPGLGQYAKAWRDQIALNYSH
jgi:sugar (pentulose or hexulose) kinase